MKTLLALLLSTLSCAATTWYVDSIASGSHNGTTWPNAWTSLGAVTGVHGGDTVYISGGPSGTSQTYNISSGGWSTGNGYPPGASSGGPSIIYQIGQDASHNGTAIFNGGGSSYLVYTYSGNGYFTFSGDAGDGQRHISLTNYSGQPFVIPLPGVRISYVDLGSPGQCFDGQGVSHFELDNCFCRITGNTADHFMSMGFNDSGFDGSIISNNVIYVPHGNGTGGIDSGDGADCFVTGGSGYTFIYNKVMGYDSGYSTTAQHQDGFQSYTGNDIKIIGNYFYDCGNAAIFFDITGPPQPAFGFTNVIVANNICAIASTHTVYPNGILLLPQYGSGTSYFVNFCIANNTLVDYAIGTVNSTFGMNIGAASGSPASVWTAVLVENNIYVNTPIVFNVGTSAVTNLFNVSMTKAQGTNSFVKYQLQGANNDYHLVASDVSLINQGQNLSSYVTTDKDGNSRPPSGPWDIGAYRFTILGGLAPYGTQLKPRVTVTGMTIQ